jgi:hypothetical protein
MRIYHCLLSHNAPMTLGHSPGFKKWRTHSGDRCITTPMHTDRRKLIGCDAKVIYGG